MFTYERKRPPGLLCKVIEGHFGVLNLFLLGFYPSAIMIVLLIANLNKCILKLFRILGIINRI